jgi:hypothetical protein
VIEDMMLVAASVMRGRPFTLTEFISATAGGFDLPHVFASDSARQRMGSLMANARLINLPNATFAVRLLRSYPRLSEKAVFKHARDVQMRDLRASNCILFGGQLSDPWVDLYEDSLNFHLQNYSPEFRSGFENRHPKPGERPIYGDLRTGDPLTYARIALLPNFEANTRALLLTGMGGAETEAAADFLLAPDFVQRLPAELRSRLTPVSSHLEILLSATRVGPTVARTDVVAWRVGEDLPQTPERR